MSYYTWNQETSSYESYEPYSAESAPAHCVSGFESPSRSTPEYESYFTTYFEEPEVTLFSFSEHTNSFFPVAEPSPYETYYYYNEPSESY